MVQATNWDNLSEPSWSQDPISSSASWASTPATPPTSLAKAAAPPRPPPPTFEEHERNETAKQLQEIEARKAGQSETMVTGKKTPAPVPVDGERSVAALKRARKKAAAAMAPKEVPYVATGLPGSSNTLRPFTPPSPPSVSSLPSYTSPAVAFEVSLSDEDEDEDAKAEKALTAQLAALKFKRMAVKAVAELAAAEKAAGSDDGTSTKGSDFVVVGEVAVEGEAEVKGGSLNRFDRVGLKPGSEAEPEAAAAKTERATKHKKDQGPRTETSKRLIFKGAGKGAASVQKVGGKVIAVDPWNFVPVDETSTGKLDLGGASSVSFYPAQDLSEEEAVAALKILHCCNCGGGPLKQSEMVLCDGGKKASWQGKLFGWCRECMPDLTDREFKSQSRCTWSTRLTELGKSRDRAMFLTFETALAAIRSDFPRATQAVARELAVTRSRAMCCAWASSMAKENVHLQAARRMADEAYLKVVDLELAHPEYACSVDGRVLKQREVAWLTNMAEGMSLCYCCRRPDCGYFGMNSQWLNLEGTNRFRCPFCIDEYKPTSVVNGQVAWSFVLHMTDPTTGLQMSIPAMWPEGKDMAWLTAQIEVFSLSIASEVELANYVNRGSVDLHKLLSQEAVPRGFGKVPFAGHSNADVNRMAWEPRWHVEEWTARGYSEGARLNPAVDDLSHPYDNWGEFIAICGRVSAESRKGSRITGAEVARRMGD